MRDLVENFPKQLEDAIRIGESIGTIEPCTEIHSVVITGMGGSGIGGKIVSQILSGSSSVSILANADYSLPEYLGKNTLLIISSYSGNTEETVEAFEIGLKKGCQIACISSGGIVEKMALEHKIPFVKMPAGNPPRAMFAYSFVQQLFVLNAFGIIDETFKGELKNAIELLNKEVDSIKEVTKSMAIQLEGRIPVLYSDTWLEGVAIRWRQQINENSKLLCWHHSFPEMNHNELVGWEGADNRIAVILLKSRYDHIRTKKRMDICQPIFDSKCDTIFSIEDRGDSRLETILYFVLIGDWLSIHLAELNGVDAVEIKNIIYLKDALKS